MDSGRLDRAKSLLGDGRVEEALRITGPEAARAQPNHRALALHATALKAVGRRDEALAFDRRATTLFAGSAVAWHNLGATLGDLGRGAEAVQAMERGMALGLDGAPSWRVMARAKVAAGDLDGAERAYERALDRAPAQADLAAEYADFAWMRRGIPSAAQSILDRSALAGGQGLLLVLARARLLEAAGSAEEAANLLARAAEVAPGEAPLAVAASQAALGLDRLDEAERWAKAAEARAPAAPAALLQQSIVQLARGRADRALATAQRGLALWPDNQQFWGWAVTAARAAGDPLYRELCDYDAMVGVYDIETPPGWADLDRYLGDLSAALNAVHRFSVHPTAQSLLHGSQTQHRLTGSNDPAIRAFFQAIDAPIRRHMAAMGEGSDPCRSRRAVDYRIENAWSVRLRPGGFHKDHFHPDGWLSSAFYVETPAAALETAERQGWIRFGKPPFRTQPELPAEHYVRPRPGRLVLFPSYLWHGTEPFSTDETRLTIAFDLLPVAST